MGHWARGMGYRVWVILLVPNALFPMPYSQCPIPNAQCPMPNSPT
ncbi:MAG: hypothetical protein V7L05_20215 [Nostoc sp.]